MQPNLDILNDAVSNRPVFIEALKDLQQTDPDRADLAEALSLLEIENSEATCEAEALEAARDIAAAFGAIRAALGAKIATAQTSDNWDPAGDVDDAGYWKHELRALNRLDDEVKRLVGYEAAPEMAMSL